MPETVGSDCKAAVVLLQASGLGGTAVAGHDADQVATMTPVKDRVIKITFNADTHASMQWNFRPQQSEIYVSLLHECSGIVVGFGSCVL